MPRCTNRVTKKRKGVGGRKIIVLTRPNEPDSSVEARPRPKLPLVAPKKQTSSSKKKVRFERYEALINDSDYQSEVIDLSILSQRLLSSSLCKACKKFGLQIRSTTYWNYIVLTVHM